MNPKLHLIKQFSLSAIFVLGCCWSSTTFAQQNDLRDATSRDGMVVSVSPDGSRVGAHILENGGNAVDAAIATAFAMSVTHPTAGNIGGGGFMLVRPDDGSPPLFIDYREKAPASSKLKMYIEGGSKKNQRFVGVPGTVRGLQLAHEIYGSRTWSELVMPAVILAHDGFEMHDGLARSLNRELQSSQNDEFKRVYGKPSGAWAAGDKIQMPDLAKTLQRIADHGADGFYKGETARLVVEEMSRGEGYITAEDLANYRARIRTPIQFDYKGFTVLGAPPPSSGGITLAQMFGMVESFNLKEKGRWSVETNHVMIEAMRRAYANRAKFLGDADFVEIPKHLASKEFAKKLAETIDLNAATPSETIGPKITQQPESPETTHFSVIDKKGMAVSNTYTLEAGYGSGVVVRGGGFLLNNEMGDFNPRPGVTNTRGTIGTKPNQIAPGKRMLSSMSPVIVLRDDKVYLVTGSPGGRTIINTVFCVTLNVIEFGMNIRDAVDCPRIDHEWFPDRASIMGANDPERKAMIEKLKRMGHTVRAIQSQGDANSILVSDGKYIGAADYEYGAAIAPKLANEEN